MSVLWKTIGHIDIPLMESMSLVDNIDFTNVLSSVSSFSLVIWHAIFQLRTVTTQHYGGQ